MKPTFIVCGAIVATLSLSPPSAAQDMPTYFDGVIEKLSEYGYREARLVDTEARRVVAFDRYGSEVSLTIHPRNGSIETWDYVSIRDR